MVGFSGTKRSDLFFINPKLAIPAQTHPFARMQIFDEKLRPFFDVYICWHKNYVPTAMRELIRTI